MANLTDAGEKYLLEFIKGDYSAGSTGYDRVGLYGSISSAADSLIDSVQSITWGWTSGYANLYILTPGTLIFDVPASTIVKGVVLFNSTDGATFGLEKAVYVLETPKTFTNSGTAEVTSCSYNFSKIGSY